MRPIHSPLYRRRLQTAILVRILAILAVALAMTVSSRNPAWKVAFTGGNLVWVLGGALALNGLYLALMRSRALERHLLGFGRVQVIVDALLVGGLVYLTGGPWSWFPALFFAPILEAWWLSPGRMSVLVASLAAIALAGSAVVYQISFRGFDPDVVYAVTFEPRRELLASIRHELFKEALLEEEALAEAVEAGETPPLPRAVAEALAERMPEEANPQLLDRTGRELDRSSPPLVQGSVWLEDRAGDIPPTVRSLVDTLLVQVLGFYIVAFLTYAGSLRAREELLADTLQRGRLGVIFLGRRGRILFATNAAKRILGVPESVDLEGLRLDETVASEEAHELLDSLLRVIEGPGAGEFLWTVQAPDGGSRTYIMRVTRSEERGEGAGTIVAMDDISERLRADEAERRAERLRSLGVMGAGLAHEVRNPLSAVRAAVQELGDLGNGGEGGPLLEVALRESDRLEGLVASFLRFARREAPRLAPCDLLGVARAVARREGPPEDGGVRIQVLPGPHAHRKALADRSEIEQVLENLLRNAVEACRGRGTVRVEVGAEGAAPERVRLEVRDDGTGIGEEVRDLLGTPFFTTKHRGTGLGLAIASRILEAHRGEIRFDQAPEGGTRVVVDLPALEEGESPEVQP